MPIRPELRPLYPPHWRELSRRVRFERASGRCQGCGRPHGVLLKCWPDLVEATRLRTTRVVLAAAHLDHDPTHNRLRNLRSFCQRCHMQHDRPHHLAQRWITYRRRYAPGDFFLGRYSAEIVFEHAVLFETRTRLAAESEPARHFKTNPASQVEVMFV